MPASSRSKARDWPYRRHSDFDKKLRLAAARWFGDHMCDTHPRMHYLLLKWENWPKNIILPQVARYIEEERMDREKNHQGFPLHKYIHHGLSSQAMLFNLIGPLIVHDNFSPLRTALEAQGCKWPQGSATASFEYEDRKVFNEDAGQPTSIDLVIQSGTGSPTLFIEAKLVEREFGGCSVFADGDCSGQNPRGRLETCYLHHIGRQYWTLLEKYNFLGGVFGQNVICPLTLYYQFFRELLFAVEKGGTFVLLYDERNPTFHRTGDHGDQDLLTFLLSFVPKELQDRVAKVTIQQLVEEIKTDGKESWIGDFEKKYDLLTRLQENKGALKE